MLLTTIDNIFNIKYHTRILAVRYIQNKITGHTNKCKLAINGFLCNRKQFYSYWCFILIGLNHFIYHFNNVFYHVDRQTTNTYVQEVANILML